MHNASEKQQREIYKKQSIRNLGAKELGKLNKKYS